MENLKLRRSITIEVETTGSLMELSEFNDEDMYMTTAGEVFCILNKDELLLSEDNKSTGIPTHCTAFCLNDCRFYSVPLHHMGYPVCIKNKEIFPEEF